MHVDGLWYCRVVKFRKVYYKRIVIVLLGEQRTAWPEPNEQAATAIIIDYTADSDTANPIYQYEL